MSDELNTTNLEPTQVEAVKKLIENYRKENARKEITHPWRPSNAHWVSHTDASGQRFHHTVSPEGVVFHVGGSEGVKEAPTGAVVVSDWTLVMREMDRLYQESYVNEHVTMPVMSPLHRAPERRGDTEIRPLGNNFCNDDCEFDFCFSCHHDECARDQSCQHETYDHYHEHSD